MPAADERDQPEAGLPARGHLAGRARGGEAGAESPYCGTIQGIRDHAGLGAIQNVGVTPAHRNGGVGTALLRQAMQGFQRAGLSRVYLEVTAENVAAIRLYRRFGFVTVKTVFKAVEAAYL